MPYVATRTSTRPIAARCSPRSRATAVPTLAATIARPPMNVSHQPQARSDPGGGASPRVNSSTASPQISVTTIAGQDRRASGLTAASASRARRARRAIRRATPRVHRGGPARRPTTAPRSRPRSSRSRSTPHRATSGPGPERCRGQRVPRRPRLARLARSRTRSTIGGRTRPPTVRRGCAGSQLRCPTCPAR